MKKILLAFFSICALNACQTQQAEVEDGHAELATQYDQHGTSNKVADLNTQLGAGYISNGRYDRALLKLKKAVAEDSSYALAHNYLGILYGRLERPEKAHEEFKKSIQLSPGDSSLLNNYAIFQCEQKNYDEAQKLFARVIDNPLYIKRGQSYASAGWCALQNNDISLAEKMYQSAIKIDRNMPSAMLGLAKVNYRNANYKYAWSYFQRYDHGVVPNADALWLGINILRKLEKPDINRLASYELQLKSKFPDTKEAKWWYEGKQEY